MWRLPLVFKIPSYNNYGMALSLEIIVGLTKIWIHEKLVQGMIE
jgi:hypothetical protein